MIQFLASPEEMFTYAKQIAEQWQGFGMIALIGEMGAGKTHFCKGFADGLGYRGEVTSPTFPLLQEYRGGKMPLFHFDWHRIKSSDEIIHLGWDDYAEQGILLVEWADLFPELWSENTLVIRIESHASGRLISINPEIISIS